MSSESDGGRDWKTRERLEREVLDFAVTRMLVKFFLTLRGEGSRWRVEKSSVMWSDTCIGMVVFGCCLQDSAREDRSRVSRLCEEPGERLVQGRCSRGGQPCSVSNLS